jgi:hypothetical protein
MTDTQLITEWERLAKAATGAPWGMAVEEDVPIYHVEDDRFIVFCRNNHGRLLSLARRGHQSLTEYQETGELIARAAAAEKGRG